MGNVNRFLRKTATTQRDIEVLLTFDTRKIIRRLKNKILGRILARIGFWKILWG